MTLFERDIRPPHDPALCKREPCGRCRLQGVPTPPEPVDRDLREANGHPDLSAVNSRGWVNKHRVPNLGADLAALGGALQANGGLLWDRSHDWTRLTISTGDGERGGGLGTAETDRTIEDRIGDSVASHYQAEVTAILNRLHDDEKRLSRILEIVCPEQRKRPVAASVQNAEAAGEGWCASCFRDKGWLEPQHEGRYRGLCRFCGEWKAANGDIPPARVVAWRHDNPHRRLTEQVVQQLSKRGA